MTAHRCSCGKAADDAWRFCAYCGTRQSYSDLTLPPSPYESPVVSRLLLNERDKLIGELRVRVCSLEIDRASALTRAKRSESEVRIFIAREAHAEVNGALRNVENILDYLNDIKATLRRIE